jgi:hypothetical protein
LISFASEENETVCLLALGDFVIISSETSGGSLRSVMICSSFSFFLLLSGVRSGAGFLVEMDRTRSFGTGGAGVGANLGSACFAAGGAYFLKNWSSEG